MKVLGKRYYFIKLRKGFYGMQKHFLVFIWITIFASDLFAIKGFQILRCLRVLNSFELPNALQRIGASHIQITNKNQRNIPLGAYDFDMFEFSFPVDERVYRLPIRIERPGMMTNRIDEVSNQVVLERLKDIVGKLPKGAFQKKFSLIIHRRNKYEQLYGKSIRANVNEANNEINFYPIVGLLTAEEYDPLEALRTMRHELGHIMDSQLLLYSDQPSMSISNSWRWENAIKADGYSVSDYGDTRLEEDFAEAMMIYLESNGGLDVPFLLNKFPHRFAILDRVIGVTRDERSQIRNRVNAETYLRSLHDF